MKIKTIVMLLAAGAFLSTASNAQQLKRRPFLGVQLSTVTDSLAKANKLKQPEGARVVGIIPNSTAATLKLQPNDIILDVDKKPVKKFTDLPAMAKNFKVGEEIVITLKRKGKTVKAKGKVQPMPMETDANAIVRYDEVNLGSGGFARSIIKTPKGNGIFPAVFFIQGYNCGSLDNLPEHDSQKKLIDGLVAKGYAVYRMEKPGTGDSKGTKPCTEIGFKEEVAAFAEGLKQLKSYDFIDKENVFLFGHSLGANTAPVIASEEKVKGIVVYGVAGKPWTEYLMDVFREQHAITGTDYVKIDENMKVLLPLTYEFMVLKKTPKELAQNSTYKKYLEDHFDYDGNDHLFGRHYTFLQELHEAPGNKAWKDAGAHVLSIYGEADVAAIDPDGAKMIADVVNSYYPGKGTYEFLPRTDHGFVEVGTMKEYNDMVAAKNYAALNQKKFNPKLVEMVDTWMKQKMAKS